MDFEDNNPLGITDDEMPRRRAHQPDELPQSAPATESQRVVISEAGKSREGSSRGHITYTIRISPGITVRRRYSEFESLRKLLRRLFPCVVVPPIPEKHSLGAYAANPAHAHEDARIIEHRQRTLANFLNRCIAIPQINESWILERFLDPNTSWRELLQSDKILSLPASPLQAPPIDPASATPAHAFLPIPTGTANLARTKSSTAAGAPTSSNKLPNGSSGGTSGSGPGGSGPSDSGTGGSGNGDASKSFLESENIAKEFERVMGNGLEKRARKINKHYSVLAKEYADLGGQFNSFSLDSHGQFDKFAPAVESVGQAVDQGYMSTLNLVNRLSVEFSEPLAESVQMAATARQILRYCRQRELQVQIIKDALDRQTKQLAELQKAESEAQRMNAYLHADDRISAATEGLSISSDRDHVVDREGVHDRDHEISRERPSSMGSSFDESDDDDTARDEDGEFRDHDEDSAARSVHSVRSAHSVRSTHSAHSTHSILDGDTADLVPNTAPAQKAAAKPSTSLRRGFKLPGLSHLNHAIHGIMDVDPQVSRRNTITRLQERIEQLKSGLEVAKEDAEVAKEEVNIEIERYNKAKRDDIRQLVRSFVKCHVEWAEKNLESWVEAKQAIANS